MVQHKTPPTLTLTLPRPTEVAGLRLLPSQSSLPTHPTLVAVNLGDGPQVRKLEVGQPQTLSLQPRVTDTVTLSLLDWQDVIDRNALGFDQLKPPGLADVAVLGADGRPIAPADAARNRSREIVVDCDRGPVIAVAGRFVHTSIRTTAGALLDGGPVRAVACDRDPIALPTGQQELLISPGEAFVVDGAQLSTAGGAAAGSPSVTPAATGAWDASRREIRALRIGHPPGAGHSRKHQPRLGGAHQHRGPVDARGRQRLAAGLGGARGQPRHHHPDLRVQLAVPGRSGAGPGAAAAVGLAGFLAYPARTRRRGTGTPLGAREPLPRSGYWPPGR